MEQLTMKTRYLRFILPALALFALSFAGAGPDADPEADVKARATAYWRHRIKGEFAKAYPYESPPFREGVSLDDYYKVMGSGLLYFGAEVKSAAVQGDTAFVIVVIRYKTLGGVAPKGGLLRDIRDRWRLYDGEWYHRFRPEKKKAPEDL
jgi:hypothetical protein